VKGKRGRGKGKGVGQLRRGKGEGGRGKLGRGREKEGRAGKGEGGWRLERRKVILGLGNVVFIPFFKTGSVWSGSIGLSCFKPESNRTGWFFYFLIGLFGFFYRFGFFC
jgi:hypothetical protein